MNSTAAAPKKPEKLLAIADAWRSSEADIASFNRHLCSALARAGARVDCLVPNATAAELADAQELGVGLITADRGDLNRPPAWSDGIPADVVIGYGTSTGNAALMQAGSLPNARRVHVANEYANLIEDSSSSSSNNSNNSNDQSDSVRLAEDVDLLRSADIPAAIGPRGQREIATIAKLPMIWALTPGIAAGASETTNTSIRTEDPTPFRCVAVGDLSSFEQSGLDIVAQAFAILVRAHKMNVELVVRTTEPGFADVVRDRILKIADLPPALGFAVRVVDANTEERKSLTDDLRDASLFVLPQSSRDFGFVALEAVAEGVPVLVSTSSGIAELLIEKAPPLAALHMVAVQRNMSQDATDWSSRMADELQNLGAARARAHRLRFALRSELTWDNTARGLLERLSPDWSAPAPDAPDPDAPAPDVSKKQTTTKASLDDHSCQAMLTAFEAARATKEPGAIGATLNLLVSWFMKFDAYDELYERYAKIEHVFRDGIDLSLFKPGGEGTEPLALAAANVVFYRQHELSNDQRIDWLDRIRALLKPTQYHPVARIDLERAELLAGREEEIAIPICLDAVSAAEQMQDPWFLATALMSQATVLARLKRLKEAIEIANKALALFEQRGSRHAVANVNRLKAQIALIQEPRDIIGASVYTAEAIAGFKATQDSYGEANALLSRAQVLFARNKGDEALLQFDRAVKLYEVARDRTKQGRALALRADYYAQKNNDREAIRDLEAAEKYLLESPEKIMHVQILIAQGSAHLRLRDHTWIVDRIDEMEEIALTLSPTQKTVAVLVQICGLAKALPVPDKPRIRRVAGIAFEMAKALENETAQGWAKAMLAFAG